MRRFGEKLRGLRIRRGLTLKGLAEILGYQTHGYINEIELGRKPPSMALVIAISNLFGVSVDDLVKDDVAVGLPSPESDGESVPTPGVPFAQRPPAAPEIERLRLILSTYQDGTGMLASGGATLPGWRDFERAVALAFGGVASENKDIFDVRLPDPERANVFFGVSCKMRRELHRLDRDGRVTIELSNSAGKFWDYLNLKHIDQSNYRDYPTDVGKALLELVSQWHHDSGLAQGGNVDLSKSCYLILSWSKNGWYQLHQFAITLPNPDGLEWGFSTLVTKDGARRAARHLAGNDSDGTIFEWYGESGGQLKYYPLSENALWQSEKFRLEQIPPGQEHGALYKARTYFPSKWQNLNNPDGHP